MRYVVPVLLLLAPSADAKNCSKGKPCGDSCIAQTDTCHKTTPAPTPAPVAAPAPSPVVSSPTTTTVKPYQPQYVMWYKQASGQILLAQVGISPALTVSCWVSSSSKTLPLSGMVVTSSARLDNLPSSQHADLVFKIGAVFKSTSVYACQLAPQ